MRDIEFYLSSGIERVILGSAALQQPDLVKTAVARFGGRIAVGIDAKNGYAAAEGWTQTSDVYFTDLAKSMEQCGVQTIIFTDISKDGTLTGPNLKQLEEIRFVRYHRLRRHYRYKGYKGASVAWALRRDLRKKYLQRQP